MAGLIPSDQISTLKAAVEDHFQSFSPYYNLVVHKEPKKTISNINSRTSSAFGGPQSNESNFEYDFRSGVFSVVKVSSSQDADKDVIEELQLSKEDGDIVIKTKQAAKDFIEDGTKNERATLNGEDFNIKTSSLERNFLGKKFYYFGLGRTN